VDYLRLKPIFLIALVCIIALALQGCFDLGGTLGGTLGDSWWDGR
jgi:hypothetical protein